MALKGYDLSKWQSDKQFSDALANSDFLIIKATEGRDYTDPCFKSRQKALIDEGQMRGYYHYARALNNTFKQEADNFLNAVGEDAKNALLILDWEGESLSVPFTGWGLAWLDYVAEKTGATPLVYASASVVKHKIKDYYHWIWTAHWNEMCKEGCDHDGADELMVQFSTNGNTIDSDLFLGTEETWMQLTGGREIAKDYGNTGWINLSPLLDINIAWREK